MEPEEKSPTAAAWDAAYDEGWQAGHNDVLPECPYEEGTTLYSIWWNAYEDGCRDR